MTDILKELRLRQRRIVSGQVCREAADEIERLRSALTPFARFADAHYTPGIGLGVESDLGAEYVWLCPSPGYPKITTECFTTARSAMSPSEGSSET